MFGADDTWLIVLVVEVGIVGVAEVGMGVAEVGIVGVVEVGTAVGAYVSPSFVGMAVVGMAVVGMAVVGVAAGTPFAGEAVEVVTEGVGGPLRVSASDTSWLNCCFVDWSIKKKRVAAGTELGTIQEAVPVFCNSAAIPLMRGENVRPSSKLIKNETGID